MTDIHEEILYAESVDERISELEEAPADEDSEGELAELSRFREEVQLRYGARQWDSGLSFVRSDYADEYADTQAEDAYGEAATSDYWDRARWREDYYREWDSFELDGTVYLTDGQR